MADVDLSSLTNLGEGSRAEYQKRISDASSDTERKEILAQAHMVNDMEGMPLEMTNDLDMNGKAFELNEDGTVTGDDLVLAYMSGAHYWKVGDTTFELCPDKECTYSASWKVVPHLSAMSVAPYTFTLQANGEDTDVVRLFDVRK